MKRNFYYGWVIALALAITETASYGIMYYAFSVMLVPMEAELGWSRAQLTGAFSLMLLVSAAMAFPIGAWVDKHGAHLLMTVGSIGASLCIIAWSQVTNIYLFFVIFFVLGICSAAVLYEPAFAVIAQWFHKRRTNALAVVTFAAGFASTIFIPLADVLLNAFGWRDAMLILGIALAAITIPIHAFALRRRPQDLGLLPDGETMTDGTPRRVLPSLSLSDALHSRFFWILTLGFGLSNLAASATRVHFIPFLIDSGINASTAAYASGTIGIMQVAGRVIFAPLDNRLSGRVMVAGVFALQAAAISFLLFGASLLTVGIFVVTFGTSYGARTLARPSILAELFGSASYGRISSVMAIFLTIAATTAPVGAGLLYDRFASYVPVLWIVLALSVVSAGLIIASKPNVAVGTTHTPQTQSAQEVSPIG